MQLNVTSKARRQIRKLPPEIGLRIAKKIRWYAKQKDPLSFSEPLTNSPYGGYRFLVGKYRVFFDISSEEVRIITILQVRKRDQAYK